MPYPVINPYKPIYPVAFVIVDWIEYDWYWCATPILSQNYWEIRYLYSFDEVKRIQCTPIGTAVFFCVYKAHPVLPCEPEPQPATNPSPLPSILLGIAKRENLGLCLAVCLDIPFSINPSPFVAMKTHIRFPIFIPVHSRNASWSCLRKWANHAMLSGRAGTNGGVDG